MNNVQHSSNEYKARPKRIPKIDRVRQTIGNITEKGNESTDRYVLVLK